MSTFEPLGDFYLPGPAARDAEPEPGPFPLREDDDDGIDDEVVTESSAIPWQRPRSRSSQAGSRRPEPPERGRGRGEAADETAPADSTGGRGRLLLALLLVAAVMVAGWYLAQPTTLPIRQVSIEGEFRQLSRAELQQLISQELRGGFFSMDVTALRNAVTASPWVRDVQVQRVWPDTLKVSVREQTAVAQWGDSGLVNSGGDYFEPEMATAPAGLPRLQGPPETQAQLTARLLLIQEALAPIGMELQTLTLSDRRAWSFATAGGLAVVLGREAFEARLARFVELVPASLGDRLDAASYIDMRYTNGFAVQFAEDSGKPAKGPNQGNGAA
ncbi:MAG: FtsQ-type POTRA domain-containing protein [Gammaproteobacteria bacterium]|nr:FtsQ-type POTRA domain-containing protein [Gammaproteobacteria bacterium]